MTPQNDPPRGGNWLRMAMQAACAGYFVFLTLLLLSQDPSRCVPASAGLWKILALAMPYAHFLSFALLSFLVLSVRWKLPRWALFVLMAAYGGATELAQGFVPGRTPDWLDWFQDVLGVAVGAVVCIAAAACLRCWQRAEAGRLATAEKVKVPAA